MITTQCYSREWLENLRQLPGYSRIDYVVMEKFILALSLVEKLKVQGLNFIFKGGTALSLLLDGPKRFSIDVDIVTETNDTDVRRIIESICSSETFSHYEFDERRSFINDIPLAHYKLYFSSATDNRENYIMLDVLYEKNNYHTIVEKAIKNQFVSSGGDDITIKLPSIESITGEKMTAFAPTTIGIRFDTNKELEIVKQIYDLGNLFDFTKDFEVVAKSYELIAQVENKYRGINVSTDETLIDTINASLMIAWQGRNKNEDLLKKSGEIKRGIMQFQSYTIIDHFRIDEAIEASAKASLIAAKVMKKDFQPIEPFDKRTGIKKYLIESSEYNYLNKLKSLPNRSLYYWNQTIKLL